MKIYFLGNSLLSTDNLPRLLIPQLSKQFPLLSFIHYDPTEEFPKITDGQLVLIDTVEGITIVKVFNNLNMFSLTKSSTVHDFDLSLQLGLLKKLGKIKNLMIIGVPMKSNLKKVMKEIIPILTSISPSENGKRNSYRDQKL
jgi:hypothetical protein